MNCSDISQIKFSDTSIKAIKEIRGMIKKAKALTWAIGIGNIANIFVGNDALKASYNLHSTDFTRMAEAMQAVPAILRKRVSDTASIAYLNVTQYKEKLFWQAVVAGCKIK